MKNVSCVNNCFGCGVCSTICPKSVINIELNKNGFYTPKVNDEGCIECGLCLKTCSFLNEGLALDATEEHAYAAWSNDAAIRDNSSSGGIGYEIGRQLIEKGYNACGVRYDVYKARAEHFVTSLADEYRASVGSKYMQSYTVDGFRSIDLKGKWLVTGTPCQIDSFRRLLKLKHKEDNFILMDFFCHGVPSMWMWQNYLNLNQPVTGELKSVSWRNKRTGWHDSWAMKLVGEKSEVYSLMSKGDLFYRLFLGGWCMNKACIKNCKYKWKASSADIRIGDLWGPTYQKEEKGVSALITFTEKGEKVVKGLQNCSIKELPFETSAEGQMKFNAKNSYLHFLAQFMLNHSKQISFKTWNFLSRLDFYLHIPKIIFDKIRSKQ